MQVPPRLNLLSWGLGVRFLEIYIQGKYDKTIDRTTARCSYE